MNKNIQLFKNRTHFAFAMIDKYINQVPNKVISDIGAGFGHMKAKVEEVGACWQPFDYIKKMDFSIIWDVNYPAPKEAKNAGMVILLEVLEHLPNPLLSLQNIAQHIEKDGILILSTPNPQSSKNRLNLLLKGTLYAFQEKHLKEYHVFTPWEHIVKQFLTQAGFEILEYAIIDMEYRKQIPSSLKGFVKYVLERLIEWRYEKSKGMSCGLVARKI